MFVLGDFDTRMPVIIKKKARINAKAVMENLIIYSQAFLFANAIVIIKGSMYDSLAFLCLHVL